MSSSDDELEHAGLLDGLRDEERGARMALLRELEAAGVSVETMREAAAEDRLALLPVELALGADYRHTVAETAEASGLPAGLLVRQRMALGLPRPEEHEPAFTDANVRGAQGLARMLEAGVSEAQLNELARIAGRGTAQLADAAIEVLTEAVLEPGLSEHEFALRAGRAMDLLIPLLAPLIEGPLRAHLRDRVRREVVGRAERASGRLPAARDVAVCFADLVGFTQFGAQATVEQLDGVVMRLGEVASEVARPPVQLVKLIGDAAMLVSPDADALVDAALSLIVSGADRDRLPPLRAGIATGPALRRGGDWYGHTVNLASRVCDQAPSGGVAVTEALTEAFPLREWRPLGDASLRGIDEPVRLFLTVP